LEAVRRLCHAHDPSRLLAAGYSITRNADGGLIRSPQDVQAGGQLVTTVAGGRLISRVENDTEGELA
ncbi:MAG: exodeoxyribonuclease VII large subunit, partial [Actinomycetes bacterium]